MPRSIVGGRRKRRWGRSSRHLGTTGEAGARARQPGDRAPRRRGGGAQMAHEQPSNLTASSPQCRRGGHGESGSRLAFAHPGSPHLPCGQSCPPFWMREGPGSCVPTGICAQEDLTGELASLASWRLPLASSTPALGVPRSTHLSVCWVGAKAEPLFPPATARRGGRAGMQNRVFRQAPESESKGGSCVAFCF